MQTQPAPNSSQAASPWQQELVPDSADRATAGVGIGGGGGVFKRPGLSVSVGGVRARLDVPRETDGGGGGECSGVLAEVRAAKARLEGA